MSAQQPDLLTCFGVPEPDDTGSFGGDDLAPVGADVGDVDDARQPGDPAQALVGVCVPDLDIVVAGLAVPELARAVGALIEDVIGPGRIAGLPVGLGADR